MCLVLTYLRINMWNIRHWAFQRQFLCLDVLLNAEWTLSLGSILIFLRKASRISSSHRSLHLILSLNIQTSHQRSTPPHQNSCALWNAAELVKLALRGLEKENPSAIQFCTYRRPLASSSLGWLCLSLTQRYRVFLWLWLNLMKAVSCVLPHWLIRLKLWLIKGYKLVRQQQHMCQAVL